MSRSYKHTPVYGEYSRNTTRYLKRQASHKVRRSSDVPNGKAYRKFFNPWNIRDYISRESYLDAIAWYNKYALNNSYDYWYKKYPTLEEYINKVWKKYYYRK